MSIPMCPVTGQPAIRNIQWIETHFLAGLWRITFRVNARSSFGEVKRIGLWESPTGLYFFDPMLEGNHEFYTQFYERLIERNLWRRDHVRCEFKLAARRINPGDRVLDVGCGFASFKSAIGNVVYVGLDPHFGTEAAIDGVCNETLNEHLRNRAGSYDVVCAFQVLEHLQSPTAMFADMVRAARPGGLVIVGVPHVPSALTRIPNFVLNAPPHHMTWWTEAALQALAKGGGATVETIERVPWGDVDALMYWMERCSPIKCTNVHYRDTWPWYAAGVVGYLAGRLVYRVRNAPKMTTDEGAGLLLVARRAA